LRSDFGFGLASIFFVLAPGTEFRARPHFLGHILATPLANTDAESDVPVAPIAPGGIVEIFFIGFVGIAKKPRSACFRRREISRAIGQSALLFVIVKIKATLMTLAKCELLIAASAYPDAVFNVVLGHNFLLKERANSIAECEQYLAYIFYSIIKNACQ